MKLKDAVKQMLSNVGLTQRGLSAEVYSGNVANISVPLSRDNMKVETLIRWAHQCGYDLVLQPAGCLVDGQIVLGEEAMPRHLVKMEYDLNKAMEAQKEAGAGKGGDSE